MQQVAKMEGMSQSVVDVLHLSRARLAGQMPEKTTFVSCPSKLWGGPIH